MQSVQANRRLQPQRSYFRTYKSQPTYFQTSRGSKRKALSDRAKERVRAEQRRYTIQNAFIVLGCLMVAFYLFERYFL